KRWESNRRLPVRRLPNGSRSAVFAYESELRAWLDKDGAGSAAESLSPQAASPSPRDRPLLRPRTVLAAFVLTAIATAGVTALRLELPSRQNAGTVTSGNTGAHVPGAEAQAL